MSDEAFYNPHDNRHVGERLRRCRKRMGITQVELAAKIGIKSGKQCVHKWEYGRSTPRKKFRQRINNFFQEEIYIGFPVKTFKKQIPLEIPKSKDDAYSNRVHNEICELWDTVINTFETIAHKIWELREYERRNNGKKD